MRAAAWAQLEQALSRWTQAGRVADFWLRDDDAVEPSPALERLLELGDRHAVPMTLAVIPARAGAALAERLADAPLVTVALHGWSHQNHAPADEKKQEFGPHRPHEVMLAELREGEERLRGLFGDRFVPLFVPPWNRTDPSLVSRLPEAGLSSLSAFGPARSSSVPIVNTNVDIIDWHGTRGGRDEAALVAEIVAQLDRMFDKDAGAVGVLTHHLVHDAAAWAFLERLFGITAGHPSCHWSSVTRLSSDVSL